MSSQLFTELNSKPEKINDRKQFQRIALGGTFDRLHKGHRAFLKQAFKCSQKVTIGITSDAFAKVIHSNEVLLSHRQRASEVDGYLSKLGLRQRFNLVTLKDLYGPTIKKDESDSLLVTDNTLKGGERINQKRKELKLPILPIIIFSMLRADDGEIISSTRIRNGEINREGIHFFSHLSAKKNYRLADEHRTLFQKPFGKVFKGAVGDFQQAMIKAIEYIAQKKFVKVICVGDVVTPLYLKYSKNPDLLIVDFHVQRQKKYSNLSGIGAIEHLFVNHVKNPPGNISSELINSIKTSLSANQASVIRVKGEEDLAVLPCTLLAPLHTAIIYGHYKKGLVVVEVTEKKKEEALKLLKLFE